MNQPPFKYSSSLVPSRMVKHIVLKSIYMVSVTFAFIYYGQYIILEPVDSERYDTSDKFVVSGRVNEYGANSTYAEIFNETGDYSRHLTWLFQFFIMMQIWNLICSSKIHNDKGCLGGFFTNCSKIFGVIILLIG